MAKKHYNVAIVGATGAGGEEAISILENRRFPVKDLIPLASAKSEGKVVNFQGREVSIRALIPESFEDVDIAIFSAGGSISKKYADFATSAGAYVVDNSSFFRMHDDVPLVVPEINGHILEKLTAPSIIANPNCSTAIMLMPIYGIHRKKRIKRIIVSTYQSVSGAGRKGMLELEEQTRQIYNGIEIDPKAFAHQIAFNTIPHVDSFGDPSGFSGEETKMHNETRKILGDPKIGVCATCVRVPIFIGHAESVNITTQEDFEIEELKEIMSSSKGCVVVDDPEKSLYPLPIHASGQDDVLVGRIRRDESHPNTFSCWLAGDNLRKGAALNAVQIAEELVKRKII